MAAASRFDLSISTSKLSLVCPPGSLLTAAACAESGDPAQALSLLDAARRVAPMRADVRSKIGDIARSLGDNEGAITAYRDALQLDPDLAVVRYRLAQLLQGKGQNREAEAELAAAIDTVPTYADAILELATLRRRLGYAEDALGLLVELLQRDPYHLDALIALGEALGALGREADASQAFARVLVLRVDGNDFSGLWSAWTVSTKDELGEGRVFERRRSLDQLQTRRGAYDQADEGAELGHGRAGQLHRCDRAR